MVASERFDDGWSDEPVHLLIVGNRQAELLERLGGAGDDARVRLRQRTVKVEQHYVPALPVVT